MLKNKSNIKAAHKVMNGIINTEGSYPVDHFGL